MTQACLLEPSPLAMRTKDTEVFVLRDLKDKKQDSGAFFITWHQLSIGEKGLKLGPADMEKKGAMKTVVPVLESPE